MGKTLIIKGADFSKNCISEIVEEKVFGYSQSELTEFSGSDLNSGSPYCIVFGSNCGKADSLSNGRLTKVIAHFFNVVSVDIYKVSKTDMSSKVIMATITPTTTGYQEIVLDTPIVLDSDNYIGFRSASTKSFPFQYGGSTTDGFQMVKEDGSVFTSQSKKISIDFIKEV